MEKCSTLFTISFILANIAILTQARDPDLVKDFVIPPNMNPDMITSQFFTYTGLRPLQNVTFTGPAQAMVNKVNMKEFTTLDGQGVSCHVITFPPAGMNLPHLHTRAAELMLVLDGTLNVGFVDTSEKLYNQTLKVLDLFVFPRGTVHFQANPHHEKPAMALAMFGSGNAGTVSLAKAMFKSGINADVLAKVLNTDDETVAKLVKANED